MASKIIYPGTFDPITNGHVDIIERACKLFDHVIIAVAASVKKNTLFSLEERVLLVQKTLKKCDNIEVCAFSGLLVDLVHNKKIPLILRGLRAISDFEYELQLANLNRHMDSKIETIFLAPSEHYSYISASMVREIASLHGNVSGLVPRCVSAALHKKLK